LPATGPPARYELHASQISDWKQQVLSNGGGLFESGKSEKVSLARADNSDKLYEQIGRLQVENAFLKNFGSSGIIVCCL
jgi:transposase